MASGIASLSITPSRVAAANVFSDLRSGELLDAALDRHADDLDARDKRWVRELLYGTLRQRGWLDALLESRVRGGLSRLDDDVTDLLRLGMYQLLFMRSVPPYAAIGQTVELAKRRHGIGASKLVNAVLRRLDRESAGILDTTPESLGARDPVDALSIRYSHPRWLVARWVGRWGAEATRNLLERNNTEAPLTVRPYGIVREQLEATLDAAGIETEEVALVPNSLILRGAGSITEVGSFRQGLFFVQDPAATLVTHYAAIPAGAVVADLCAAPGGKALELSRTAGRVIASDRSFSRMALVTSNLERLDVKNVSVMIADARRPAIAPVDAVLIDVPCTGTGTFRRHPDARWRLKISDLAVMAALQRAILSAAANVVKPGGLLIYSTCSLEPEENDSQIENFLSTNPDWSLEPPPAGSVAETVLDAGRLRVLPQVHGVDGAFAARLRRKS
jgi:16S rRNA (cytosine967-C5)-methyltransferase